tara:strand:- start:66 stop:554 length:489 start_codon:yes stop_codon:yes gene_type:complete
MKRFLVFVLILVASNITFSQSKKMSSKNNLNGNNFSLNLGSALIINGIGLKYERLIPRKKVYYTLMGGVHFNRINFFGFEDHLTVYFSNGLITGINKRKHFEASLGLGLDMYRYPQSTGFRYVEFAPIFNIGYRFQVPDESYVFRSGIGFPELIYLGFGLSF